MPTAPRDSVALTIVVTAAVERRLLRGTAPADRREGGQVSCARIRLAAHVAFPGQVVPVR